MDFLKKYFPFSFKATDVAALIIAIVVYVVIGLLAGFVIGLINIVPLVNIVCKLLGALVELYVLVGIVTSILVFCKVLK